MPHGTRSASQDATDATGNISGDTDTLEKTPDRLHAESWSQKKRPIGRKRFPTARTHGTRSTYNAGCGCEDCTRAERIYSRERYRQVRRVSR